MSRRELALQKRIVAAIVKAGGMARIRAQSAFTVTGDPDIYGTLGSVHLEIEVKEPGEEPTKIQLHRLKEWKKAGAFTAVVSSVEELKKHLLDWSIDE